MYHSKMKTKQVYLYDSTFATPFSLLLWGARVRHERPLGHTKKSSIEVIIGELLLRYAILKEQCRSCSLDGAQGFCGLLELAQLSVGAVLGLQHESEDRSFAISFPPYPPPRPQSTKNTQSFESYRNSLCVTPLPSFAFYITSKRPTCAGRVGMFTVIHVEKAVISSMNTAFYT